MDHPDVLRSARSALRTEIEGMEYAICLARSRLNNMAPVYKLPSELLLGMLRCSYGTKCPRCLRPGLCLPRLRYWMVVGHSRVPQMAGRSIGSGEPLGYYSLLPWSIVDSNVHRTSTDMPPGHPIWLRNPLIHVEKSSGYARHRTRHN